MADTDTRKQIRNIAGYTETASKQGDMACNFNEQQVSDMEALIAAKERVARTDELYKAYNEVVGEPSVPLRSKFVKVFTKYLYSRIAALRGEAPASGEQQNGGLETPGEPAK